MADTIQKLLPGTAMTYADPGEKGFSKIEMLISATGGLSLSQVCAVTGLEGSTIQNWVKRGWVKNPNGKKYVEVHIARILIINALKECIKLEHISHLMSYATGPDGSGNAIKESELFNFLCDALHMLGQADDLSRSGVEAVAEAVTKDVGDEALNVRIRKALAVMVYACVCTDVKRRTEIMMDAVLKEYENAPQPAEPAEEPAVEPAESDTAGEENQPEETPASEESPPEETPETEKTEDSKPDDETESADNSEKSAKTRSWFRKGS